MKEVITEGKFGVCPMCGKPLILLETMYSAYGLIDVGTFPNKLLNRKYSIKSVCMGCGYSTEMVRTMDGIFPKKYYKLEENKKELEKGKGDALLLGYIED